MALYYPPVGFHFKVEFERFPSNSKDIRFKEVGGLSVEIPVENLSEGGENRFKYSLPATPQYPKLVLKRGLLGDSQIADWCKKAIEDFVFETDNITVSLLNEQHEPLALWRVIGAYPCKWSVSDLNADQNAIVVESIEFAYQYFIYEKNP